MSPELSSPKRPVWRRWTLATALVVPFLLLSGCSQHTKDEWGRFAMPEPATVQAHENFDLWKWSWVAALITGVIVWGLIFYAAWRFRRTPKNQIPVQTRYNLPLEIFYTIAPVMMVIVFFVHTVKAQDEMLAEVPNPDHTVEVIGQQWSWTFNYTGEKAVDGENVYEAGTASQIPTLVLPVNETTQFYLRSPDVIHSFWVVGFLMKMDVVPGRVNHFQVTPTTLGTYKGKCTELCGFQHSRMLFNVEVVTADQYDAYLQKQRELGFVSDGIVAGGTEVCTQAGLAELATDDEPCTNEGPSELGRDR